MPVNLEVNESETIMTIAELVSSELPKLAHQDSAVVTYSQELFEILLTAGGVANA